MKKISLTIRLSLVLIGILLVSTFVYDFYRYYSSSSIVLIDYLSEIFSLLVIFIYYRYLQTTINLEQNTIRDNLKLFIKLLGFLYISVFILKLIWDGFPLINQNVPSKIMIAAGIKVPRVTKRELTHPDTFSPLKFKKVAPQ